MKNPNALPGQRGRAAGGKDLLKGHDVKYIYRRLWSYISHYKLFFAVAIILMFVKPFN